MKSKIIQCADRPRIERHGQSIVVKFSDAGYSESLAEMNISQAWALASDIMEIVNEYKTESNVHPVFRDILDRIERTGEK